MKRIAIIVIIALFCILLSSCGKPTVESLLTSEEGFWQFDDDSSYGFYFDKDNNVLLELNDKLLNEGTYTITENEIVIRWGESEEDICYKYTFENNELNIDELEFVTYEEQYLNDWKDEQIKNIIDEHL